jgi:ubiquinone/menaquinone biosynthesis C-methylase UbiE
MTVKDSQLFAAFWSFVTRHEDKHTREVRAELVGGARGRVLEIGCGVGANFKYYSADVAEVIATEPNSFMLKRAIDAATSSDRPISVRAARAEDLPFDDSSFDAVVSTLNMCTIENPQRALAEVRRVLKPGGEYRFFDHVQYDHAFGRFWQNLIDPLWSRMLRGGCHPNRDIAGMVRGAGFRSVQMEFEKSLPPVPPMVFVRPHIKGVATV